MATVVIKLLFRVLPFAIQAFLVQPPYSDAASVPPGDTLQDYLCGNGSLLHSNMTLALEGGEHRIPSGPFCFVYNVSNVLITGSPQAVTTIRCQGERGFGFVQVRDVTIERVTIVGCGQYDKRIRQPDPGQTLPVVIYFERSFDISIRKLKLAGFSGIGTYGFDLHVADMSEVVFDGCAINTSCSAGLFEDSRCGTDQLRHQDTGLTVQSCVYQSLFGIVEFSAGISLRCVHVKIRDSVFEDLGGAPISAFQVNVSIENSTFVGNRAKDIVIQDSNTTISRCRFNGHQSEEAISITSTRRVTTLILESVFQNYSIDVLDIRTGTGVTRITNCTFENNGARTIQLLQTLSRVSSQEGGPVVCAEVSKCMFARNRPGAVNISTNVDSLSVPNCSNVVTQCTFYNNSGFSSTNKGILIFYITITSDSLKASRVGNELTINNSFSTHLYANVSGCLFENNNEQLISMLIKLNENKALVSLAVTDCVFLHNRFALTPNVAINVEDHGSTYGTVQVESIVVRGCTFQGNKGGAVRLHGISGSVEFEYCNFTGNSVIEDVSLLEIFSFPLSLKSPPFCNLSVSKSVFEMNRGQLILMLFRSSNEKLPSSLVVKECSFLQNTPTQLDEFAINLKQFQIPDSATLVESIKVTGCKFHGNSGGAMQLNGVIANVDFTNCTFTENNSSQSAGLSIELPILNSYPFWKVSISRCVFEMNRGLSIFNVFIQPKDEEVPLHVSIVDCSFNSFLHHMNNENNHGVVMINGIMHVESIVVVGCTFQRNTGRAVLLRDVTGNVEFENCTFTENSDEFGAGLAIVHLADSQSHSLHTVTVRNSTFINNIAATGAAIYFVNGDYSVGGKITLIDVVIIGSHSNQRGKFSRGGAVYVERINVDIKGERGSEFAFNSPQGAVQGANTQITLWGKVTFANNTGENGGAISLLNNGWVKFCSCEFSWKVCNSKLTFSGNRATGFGGAIYVGGKMDIYSDVNKMCAIKQENTFSKNQLKKFFYSNYAQLAGHAIYASPIYWCSIFDDKPDELVNYKLSNMITITPFTGTSNDSQIVSFPTYVTICCESPNLCNFYQISTFPGRTVQIYVSLVDYGYNLSPGIIYTQIEASDSTTVHQNVRLGDHQNVQWVEKKCSMLEYQIYGPENTTFNLSLSSYPAYASTAIKVNFMQCIPWFRFSNGLMKCDCLPFWASFELVCDAINGTVARKGTNWIGLYTHEAQLVPALVTTCPLNYCKSNFTHISLQSPEVDVCNGERTGVLCGRCHGNYSTVFGSSECQVCSNVWLVTILMYAILGASLVALLFILNLTVTQGTLYGFIFYANIIQINTSIFFNDSVLVPLQVMISFINLDLGFPLCFYDGMDDATKSGLQFVFPAYLLILTITVIVVCHYFLSRSTHPSSSRHCLDRLSCLVGQRATGVLSTLIYLSYSKLLRTVVDVFSYSTLHIPDGSVLIWFYDGNIEYLHGKHLVLFVIALVISIFFLIPYTLALTFIPIIEHFSEHNRVFHCLNKVVNRMKPMNDAHYAPYKVRWRWWLGARLTFLLLMCILNPVYSSDNPSLLLFINGTTLIGFISVQGFFQPFGVQMSAKNNSITTVLNGFYNWLDLFSLIDYALLALSVSYIQDHGTDSTQMNVAIGVLVGLFCLVFLAVVLLHVIVAFLKVCNMYDTMKEKIINHSSFTHNFAAIELERPSSDNDVINTDDCAVREPLLLEDF